MPALLDAPDVVMGEPPAVGAPDRSVDGRSIAGTTRNLVARSNLRQEPV